MKFFDKQVLKVYHLHYKLASDICHETLNASDNIHTVA
jgi:hypothetical protein